MPRACGIPEPKIRGRILNKERAHKKPFLSVSIELPRTCLRNMLGLHLDRKLFRLRSSG